MSAAQLTREPCRQLLRQSRPTTCTAVQSITACQHPARRTFSQSHTFRADDEDDGAGAGRVRQAKTPTRLRRRMYAWLNGPGRAFVNPLPGSTNYLSAYDSKGRLRRSRIDKGRSQDGGADEGGEGDRGGLPPARDHEQRPYPLNENFTSQAVLSEALKDAIYNKVVVDGQSVSAASAHFNVDMRRVAAVVRLKEVEKNWQKKVSVIAIVAVSPCSPIFMMIPFKNRLVLKTHTWLQILALRASLINYHTHLPSHVALRTSTDQIRASHLRTTTRRRYRTCSPRLNWMSGHRRCTNPSTTCQSTRQQSNRYSTRPRNHASSRDGTLQRCSHRLCYPQMSESRTQSSSRP